MFIILFGFWLLLNGRWSTEIAVTGAVISLLISLLCWCFFGLRPEKELMLAKRFGRWIGYLAYLAGEVCASGIRVIRLIWSPTLVAEPVLFAVKTRLRTRIGRVSFANSITLTPGTITVALEGDTLLVHALDTELAEGLAGGAMESRILKVEEGGERHA